MALIQQRKRTICPSTTTTTTAKNNRFLYCVVVAIVGLIGLIGMMMVPRSNTATTATGGTTAQITTIGNDDNTNKYTNDTSSNNNAMAKIVPPLKEEPVEVSAQKQQEQQQNVVAAATTTTVADHNLPNVRDPPHIEQCNVMKHSPVGMITKGKPIWISGYPGSGFWIVEKMIPKLTGFDPTIVPYKHQCIDSHSSTTSTRTTAFCLTHYPFLHYYRNIPLEYYGHDHTSPNRNSFNKYYNRSIVLIRNPVHAIPSFFIRWYGKKKWKQRNQHEQPKDRNVWKNWRSNTTIYEHIMAWKSIIMNWHDGLHDSQKGYHIDTVGLYIPYEYLIDKTKGPILIQEMTQLFQSASHPTILPASSSDDSDNNGNNRKKRNKQRTRTRTLLESSLSSRLLLSNETDKEIETSTTNTTVTTTTTATTINADIQCIWNEVVKPGKHRKEYDFTYAVEQKKMFLDAIDELLLRYKSTTSTGTKENDSVLIELLQMYRHDIDTTLKIESV